MMTVRPTDRGWVAIVLAGGLILALNIFVLAVLYDAIVNDEVSGLSENATRVLSLWGSGVIGILGALFGYRAAQTGENDAADRADRAELRAERRAARKAEGRPAEPTARKAEGPAEPTA